MTFPIEGFHRSHLLSSRSEIEQNQIRSSTNLSADFSALLDKTAASQAANTTSEISALVEEIDAIDQRIAALRTQLQHLQESGVDPTLIQDEVNRIEDELDSLSDKRKMLFVELQTLQTNLQRRDKQFGDEQVRDPEDDIRSNRTDWQFRA